VDWAVASPMSLYFISNEVGGTPKAVSPFAREQRSHPQYRSVGTGAGQGADYFSVALVRTEDCSMDKGKVSLSSFKGKRSCHTRYGDMASWVFPAWRIARTGISAGATDVEVIQHCFSASCAPSNGDIELCSGCVHQDNCNLDDPFAGDHGVVECLRSGQGDIAFMDNYAAAASVMTDQRFTVGNIQGKDTEFQLLCDEGCESISEATRVRSLCMTARLFLRRLGILRPGALLFGTTSCSHHLAPSVAH
jgi:hypothetical protein